MRTFLRPDWLKVFPWKRDRISNWKLDPRVNTDTLLFTSTAFVIFQGFIWRRALWKLKLNSYWGSKALLTVCYFVPTVKHRQRRLRASCQTWKQQNGFVYLGGSRTERSVYEEIHESVPVDCNRFVVIQHFVLPDWIISAGLLQPLRAYRYGN